MAVAAAQIQTIDLALRKHILIRHRPLVEVPQILNREIRSRERLLPPKGLWQNSSGQKACLTREDHRLVHLLGLWGQP
jgi:hypothetical protein